MYNIVYVHFYLHIISDCSLVAACVLLYIGVHVCSYIFVLRYAYTYENIHTVQYNTISFNGTKNTPADTDATEDYTKKLNNIAYWKRQEDESFLSYFMIAEKHKLH